MHHACRRRNAIRCELLGGGAAAVAAGGSYRSPSKRPQHFLIRQCRRVTGGLAGAGGAGARLHAARITDTGLLYLQPKSAAGAGGSPVAGAAALPAGPQFAPGFRGSLPDHTGNATGVPSGRQQASRKLLQPVGTDDRWQITSPTAHAYPWRAVGYIASGCSGSLIGPSTVLTAGHVSRA